MSTTGVVVPRAGPSRWRSRDYKAAGLGGRSGARGGCRPSPGRPHRLLQGGRRVPCGVQIRPTAVFMESPIEVQLKARLGGRPGAERSPSLGKAASRPFPIHPPAAKEASRRSIAPSTTGLCRRSVLDRFSQAADNLLLSKELAPYSAHDSDCLWTPALSYSAPHPADAYATAPAPFQPEKAVAKHDRSTLCDTRRLYDKDQHCSPSCE